MSKTHYNPVESTIIRAIPSYPSDRNNLTPEEIFLAAQDFRDYFRHAVQAFEDSRRDDRLKPCMSHPKYTETIYAMLEKSSYRPIIHDKNNFYQVLFAVSCLMGLPDHKRSWWEETFALRTQDYLEATTLFQGSKQKIQATIRKINSMLQYELDFGSTNHVQTAVQQTLKLFTEAEEMKQCVQPKVKPKRAKPKPKSMQPILQLNLFAAQVDAINIDSVNTLNNHSIQ